MTDVAPELERSYGCTFGCGNPYDFVVIDARSGTTDFLCLPCFVRLAGDMVAAMTEADNPQVIAALAYATTDSAAAAPGPTGARRGKNPPATNADPDLFGSFDSLITVDELPEAFR